MPKNNNKKSRVTFCKTSNNIKEKSLFRSVTCGEVHGKKKRRTVEDPGAHAPHTDKHTDNINYVIINK